MYTCFLKRILDIFISGVCLLILLPVLLIVMCILRFSGEGDVFYIQKRVGLNNGLFNVYKFITMRRGSEKVQNVDFLNDTRVFKVGKVLRATKINELPQLFNVFIGDMSLVGPRPLIYKNFKDYPKEVRKRIYENNKPGVTGIGSLFFRHEEKILAKFNKNMEKVFKQKILPVKGALELWYKQNKSFCLDVKIIFLTAAAIFNSKPFSIKYFKGIPKNIINDYLKLIK